MNPYIRILGATLLAGCSVKSSQPTHNPPPQDPPPVANPPPIPSNPPNPEPLPPTNPPVPTALPTWDSVRSGHPEGATNPPSPTLYVARDTGACFKAWMPGMIRPPDDIMEVGGRVYDQQTSVGSDATQVVCPDGQPATLIAAWDKAKAEGKLDGSKH